MIEGLRLQEVAKTYGLYCTKITEVKSRPDSGVERLLMQFEKEETAAIQKDEMAIYQQKGKKYIFLPQAFGPFKSNKVRQLAAEVFANAIRKAIVNDWKEENLSGLVHYSLVQKKQ